MNKVIAGERSEATAVPRCAGRATAAGDTAADRCRHTAEDEARHAAALRPVRDGCAEHRAARRPAGRDGPPAGARAVPSRGAP
ncbi:hypothetical protein [Streptomyces sp. NPDC014733]|uniref:hypothetical protein n=1 Tax=Streptomyces sp. NPDC014733 TaxID=3364885 RepID=UPI0036F51132